MARRLITFLIAALIIVNAHGSESDHDDGMGKLRARLLRLVPNGPIQASPDVHLGKTQLGC